MVVIMPFIKIGQLSKHLASIGRRKSVGFWLFMCPTYFPRVFFFFPVFSPLKPPVGDLMKLSAADDDAGRLCFLWGRRRARAVCHCLCLG